MQQCAYVGSSISGMTAGEHSGHTNSNIHGQLPITGNIISSPASNIFVNGNLIAVYGSGTIEHDDCCGTSYGTINNGSNKIYANNLGVCRNGDTYTPHNGTANIASGSNNVYVE